MTQDRGGAVMDFFEESMACEVSVLQGRSR